MRVCRKITDVNDSIDATPLSDGAAVYRQAVGLLGEARGGDKRYYNSDALGSTRAIADATGSVSATKETDAFGNVWTPGTTGTQTPFGFAGQHGYQTDADSGLQKLGYRYYDASTGRFLSRDPIQDGYNWYTYCSNDPVNAVDPTGLEPPHTEPWRPRTIEEIVREVMQQGLDFDLDNPFPIFGDPPKPKDDKGPITIKGDDDKITIIGKGRDKNWIYEITLGFKDPFEKPKFDGITITVGPRF